MKLKTYLKLQFSKDEMKISDEALELIMQEITQYIEDLTKETLVLGLHKTLMGKDVDLALSVRRYQ